MAFPIPLVAALSIARMMLELNMLRNFSTHILGTS